MVAEVARFDVVVLGAGTAGANAANQLARRGLSVALLDRRPAGSAGAQWTNGVLDRHFAMAGIDPPSGAERVGAGALTHLVGPDGTRAASFTSPTVTADMSRLGERLRGYATAAGVELVDRAEHLAVELSGDRITALEVDTGPGSTQALRRRFEAALFVDATGRAGLLRRRSPLLERWCPPVRSADLCSAADFHHRVRDADGARRFLDRHGAGPGEIVTVVGPNGGFSTRAVSVSADLDRVGVLVGCLADGRHGTGPRMLDDLRREEPWIGDPVSGGFGVIPLRRPYARFTAPGLALVGDAACQVFPAHGSGIGLGLVAGRMLADAVAGSGDPGDPAVLWRYQAAFHHEHGGVLMSSDAFRRLSTDLGTPGVGELVRAGLVTERSARAALDQTWPAPPPSEVAVLGARLARHPRLAARVVPALARAQALGALGGCHPTEPDESELARWDRRVGRLIGAPGRGTPPPAG